MRGDKPIKNIEAFFNRENTRKQENIKAELSFNEKTERLELALIFKSNTKYSDDEAIDYVVIENKGSICMYVDNQVVYKVPKKNSAKPFFDLIASKKIILKVKDHIEPVNYSDKTM